ncbi:uncharacterized protein LOC131938397 [Physella acuta]|uniref:uncharacterized protein LOC131938397 n=1 Tax=Physella acuta TaxID=109671 RepID=UPI0027DD6D08|nr:uncharacterized protein LOC131938397 [Physella acuta]
MNIPRSAPASVEQSRATDVMKCVGRYYDVTEVILAYVIAGATFVLSQAMDMPLSGGAALDMDTMYPPPVVTTPPPQDDEMCCSGILGYASDNVSVNFPCQGRPCCNSSETVAVVAIDHSLGFRFQCMPRHSIQPLCYEDGTEVRTTNQDPDFIPRACCQGLKFKVVLNQWYAALVIKCVEESDDYS